MDPLQKNLRSLDNAGKINPEDLNFLHKHDLETESALGAFIFWSFVASVFIVQWSVVRWKNWHPKSYQLFSTVALLLIPFIFSVLDSLWSFFSILWILWTSGAMFLCWKATRVPIEPTTPRKVYKAFSCAYNTSVTIITTSLPVAIVSLVIFPSYVAGTWLWGQLFRAGLYSMYFAVLTRDFADLATDRMRVNLPYFEEPEGRDQELEPIEFKSEARTSSVMTAPHLKRKGAHLQRTPGSSEGDGMATGAAAPVLATSPPSLDTSATDSAAGSKGTSTPPTKLPSPDICSLCAQRVHILQSSAPPSHAHERIMPFLHNIPPAMTHPLPGDAQQAFSTGHPFTRTIGLGSPHPRLDTSPYLFASNIPTSAGAALTGTDPSQQMFVETPHSSHDGPEPNYSAFSHQQSRLLVFNEGTADQELVYKLPGCGHVYHAACIIGWCVVGKKDVCPRCGDKVVLKDLQKDWPLLGRTSITMSRLLGLVRVYIIWLPMIVLVLRFILYQFGISKLLDEHEEEHKRIHEMEHNFREGLAETFQELRGPAESVDTPSEGAMP